MGPVEVGGDVFDVHGQVLADRAVAIGLAGLEDGGELGAQSVGVEADIDEAGSGGGGFRHIRVRGEGFDDDGGDLRRLAAGGLGGDQGGVGGHVAMGGVAVRGDLDAVGDVLRQVGDGGEQGGDGGGAQAGIEVRGHGGLVLCAARGDREPGAARHGAKGPAAMPQFARPRNAPGSDGAVWRG